MKNNYTINKDNGQVRDLANIHRWIDAKINLARNGEYVLKFAKQSKPRTISQNRLMWMWFTCISQETGTPEQDIHDYYCSLYLRKRVDYKGHSQEVVIGTSGLTTAQFSEFMDRIKADAASELGIVLPLPSDLAYAEFETIYGGR